MTFAFLNTKKYNMEGIFPEWFIEHLRGRKKELVQNTSVYVYHESLRQALMDKLESIPDRVYSDLVKYPPSPTRLKSKGEDWYIAGQMGVYEGKLRNELNFHAQRTPQIREIKYESCVNFINMITRIG